MKKTIPTRYYNELAEGHTVPRNEKTGEVIPFKVGGEYDITCPDNSTVIRARCTQDCPYHLKKIEVKVIDTRPAAVKELKRIKKFGYGV